MFRTRLFPFVFLASAFLGACATPSEGPDEPLAAGASRHSRSNAVKAPAEHQTKRMDLLQLRLTETLKGQEVEITRLSPDLLRIRIAGRRAFAANEPKPLPPLLSVLDRLAEALVLDGGTRIEVEAHTDSLGREIFNQSLSGQRADVAVAHLASRGVAFKRLTATGRGESQPVADNATEAGRASNRRLDILVRND